MTAAVERGAEGGSSGARNESGNGGGGGWLPDVERGTQGRLVPYYLMLAGISAVNFLFFVGVVARKYEYKRPAAAAAARRKKAAVVAGRSLEGVM